MRPILLAIGNCSVSTTDNDNTDCTRMHVTMSHNHDLPIKIKLDSMLFCEDKAWNYANVTDLWYREPTCLQGATS